MNIRGFSFNSEDGLLCLKVCLMFFPALSVISVQFISSCRAYLAYIPRPPHLHNVVVLSFQSLLGENVLTGHLAGIWQVPVKFERFF